MTLDEYQQLALRTARKDKKDEIFHLVLGMVGESGEIAEKLKKLVRDHNSDLAKLDRNDIKKEIGDVLWYLAVLSDFLGLSFDEIAQTNIDKLADRKQRNVIQGSGDNR